MEPWQKRGDELKGAKVNNASALADQGLCLCSTGWWGGGGWKPADPVTSARGGEGRADTGPGTIAARSHVRSPPHPHVGLPGVRQVWNLRKYNLQVTLENERPMEATHFHVRRDLKPAPCLKLTPCGS